MFLEVVWPTSESAGLEVTGLKCILAIIVGVGVAFALVKLRGWRKARQLYTVNRRVVCQIQFLRLLNLLMMYMLRFMEKKASVGQISVVW